VSEIKRAMFSNQPIIVLLYKEALLNTNELDLALPSSIVSLLQEYKDVFPEETPHGLPPIRGIEHQIENQDYEGLKTPRQENLRISQEIKVISLVV
jgi:hypothetical protein